MDENTEGLEVAVIGAGITGLSIAWHLAEERVGSIAIFDGRGIGAGASGIQPGGVRQQWGTTLACGMARESFGFYSSIDQRLQPAVAPGLQRCGYIFLAETQRGLEDLERLVAVQQSMGVPSRTLTPAEVGELASGISVETIVGASYCADDGYFDRPQAVVAAFAAAGERAGVDLVSSHVRAISPNGGGWKLSLADGTTVNAAQVVVAAAWDSADLVSPLGIDLPIEREPRYLFYSDPIRERLLEPLVVAQERRFAAKQLADGSVLASDLGADGDPDANRDGWHRRIREAITALVPILEYVSFPVLVEGFYDVTPDRQPILGALDGHAGLFVAAGLNGRGLMMAPAIGRMLADVIVERSPDPALLSLGIGRFTDGELTPEDNVV
jgi:sarcosine oxidase subunit beta